MMGSPRQENQASDEGDHNEKVNCKSPAGANAGWADETFPKEAFETSGS
jgi:hypothetical protein